MAESVREALVLCFHTAASVSCLPACLTPTLPLRPSPCRLASVDPALCAQRLPKAFHTLVPQLCADQEGVRFGTSQV